MNNPSPLDNPVYAQFAWNRYWRLMRWMFGFTLLVATGMLSLFYWQHGLVSIHFYIATAGAVIVSLMLAAALMGLVFLSSETGHDEAIEDPVGGGEDHL
ncbi:MAG: hypothetical protein V3V15_05455 [Sphingorhabdus sp.]